MDIEGPMPVVTVFPAIFALIGFIGLILALVRKWPIWRAAAFALLGIAGLVGMAWAWLSVFTAGAWFTVSG